MIRFAFIALALLFAAGCSSAPSDACGIAAARDDWTANEPLHRCAAAGDARAQAYLGFIYLSATEGRGFNPEAAGLDGRGTRDQIRAEGRRLIETAAGHGNPEAQNELGLGYLEGFYGLPCNRRVALRWLRAADGGGDAVATYNLARMYYLGNGVPRNRAESLRLLWRSASRGYQPAVCTVALLSEGRGARLTAMALRLAAQPLNHGLACAHDGSDVTEDFKT